MADRTSASLFAAVFQHLAEKPDARAKEFAKWLWSETGKYDFNPYQMYCDDALRELGLARLKTKEEDAKDDTEGGVVYFGEDGF